VHPEHPWGIRQGEIAPHRPLFPHGGLFENFLFIVTLLMVPPEPISDFYSKTFFSQGGTFVFCSCIIIIIELTGKEGYASDKCRQLVSRKTKIILLKSIP
jgi:hypothetical protein